MRHITSACATVVAIMASAAHAQSASAQQTTPADNAPKSAAASSVAQENEGGLAEIIVTAQRKEESAQKADLPISVIEPAELTRQNIVRAEDLSRAIPALVAGNNGGANTTFFIRGVGNFTANSYSDPSVAFNYDDVYIGRPTNTQGLFYDLQRVEVLKGPQGTLYGRNATAGAINVIPNRPVLGQTSADVQASYGNYEAIQAQGDVNLPLGPNGAVRLAGTYSKHNGYLSDGTSAQDLYGLRAQGLLELTPDITNRIGLDYAHDGGAGTGAFQYGTTFFNGKGYSFARAPGLGPGIGLADPRTEAFLQGQFIPQVGRTSEPLNNYPYLDDSSWGVTDVFNWQTSADSDLTIQPAYRQAKINSLYTSPDFRGALTDENDKQSSVEARFAGNAGQFDYLVGGYYFKEDIKDDLVINQLILTPFQDYTTGTNSKAAFGQLAFHMTPTVTLTAGGRYTQDRKTFDGVSDNYVLFCGTGAPPQNFCPGLPLEPFVNNAAALSNFYTSRGIPVSPVPLGLLGLLPPNTPSVLEATIPINAVTKTDKFTYRFAADWQVAPRSLLYTSYETGFHGGGFSFARGLDSYQPETINAFTLGSKNRLWDNQLQANVEAFLWKYKNQQFSQFGFDLGTPPATVFYTSNVGNSTIKGVDTDLAFQATSTTRLSSSIQYLNFVYDKFITYAPNLGLPPNYGCPYAPVTYNGTPSFALNCSGKPGFNAPKWSFNTDIAQTFKLDNYQFVLQGGTRFRGSYFVAPTYQPWLLSKAAFESDAALTFTPRTQLWFISGYVNNIENKRRIVLINTSAINTLTAITSDPRTFGIRVGKHF
jgi:iron complex outermembrane receptor protein